MNVVDELSTEKNSCGIARFPCVSMTFSCATMLRYATTGVNAANISILVRRREDISQKCFRDITQPYSCLHHLPAPREQSLISRFRTYDKFRVRVTHSWHINIDMRTQEQSIRADRERKTEQNGPKVRWAEHSGSRKKRAERGAGGRGTGAERWAGWISCSVMPLRPVVLCTICTLHFLEAKRGPGPGTSRLDFGGNPITFLVCPHFYPGDQSWSLCNVCIHYTVGPILSTAGLSLQSTLSQKKRRIPVILL